MPSACALAAPRCFFFFLPLLGAAASTGCSCEHSEQPAQFRQALHLRSQETLCRPVVQRRSRHQPAHRLLGAAAKVVRLLGAAAKVVRLRRAAANIVRLRRAASATSRLRSRRRFLLSCFLMCLHSCRASTLLRCRHTSAVAFEAARLRTLPTPLGAATFFLLRCRGAGSGSARAAGVISSTGSISSSGGVAAISHLLSFSTKAGALLRPSAVAFAGAPAVSAVGALTAKPS